jgi:chromodomain-helicase-DNA-binding protein 7
VAPLSTVVNWQREIEAWTDMDAIIYHGSQEDRQLIREYEFFYMSRKKADGYKLEVVITTPETCLALDKQNLHGRLHRELSQIHWEMLIVDEAHKLKNHNSKFCSVIREEFSYQNCLLLTGTPLQNNTEELWTLLNFIDRTKFENKDLFTEEFGSLTDASQLQKLHHLLKPYLLRREKENVEKAVPPKEEVIVEVELTISQKQYYRAIYEQNTQFLYKGAIKDGPRLTNLAMELRKCCNHPFLVKGAESELIREASRDDSLRNSDTGYVDMLVQSSGKMVLLDKLLPKLQSQGHRVLIFSQFRIMLDIIEDYLLLRQVSYDRIDGAVTGRKRQAVIDKYCAPDSSVFVMLLSTKAGGVGINLTAADTVIIFDR